MSDPGTDNQREFSRVPVKLDVWLKTAKQEVRSLNTRDISMKGLFMECDRELDHGTLCDLTLILMGTEEPLKVNVKGIVARRDKDGLAIQFTELDLESYDHLHNLVLLNSNDPDAVEQEMREHVGLNKRQ